MARRPKTESKDTRSLFMLIPRHGAFPIALLAGVVAAGATLLLGQGWLLASVIGGDAMFLTYLGIVALEIPRLTPEFLRRHAGEENVPVWVIFIVTLAVVALCAFSLFSTLNSPEAASAPVV